MTAQRNYAWGPQIQGQATSFSLWAPKLSELLLDVDGRTVAMHRADDGWFSSLVDDVSPGAEYMFILPDGSRVPDPASRFQIEVCGPSRLVNGHNYRWEQNDWKGLPWEEAIVYELHVGTFTPEGTFSAASERFRRLADLGFTAIELMPLAHFPGTRGWGYDGVFQYAPHSAYGSSDDFKRLIDTAHQHQMMVFLDVVYNHFGPEGNFLSHYAPRFFKQGESTPWGDKINFQVMPVRRFFIDNVLYWLDEFRLDGLRLDAVDQIEDAGELHVLEEISRAVHERFKDRHVHLVTENPVNGTDLLAATKDGSRLYTADWNDDFHHALHVAVTGETTGHFAPFKNKPWASVKRALAKGHLQDGKPSVAREAPPSASLPPTSFVHFLQNHDQVGNRALGERLNTMIDERLYRVLMEILLLSPQIPLVFMGEEHASRQQFHYFCDYQGDLAEVMEASRPQQAENFGGFPHGTSPDDIRNPNDFETFVASKINWNDAQTSDGAAWQAFVKQILSVRKQFVVPLLQNARGYAGEVICDDGNKIFVDWTFQDKSVLKLRANPSGSHIPLREEKGALIYPFDNITSPHALPPWSTRLYLAF
jgi:malto-oligosyltrehalose trehalohydrolase